MNRTALGVTVAAAMVLIGACGSNDKSLTTSAAPITASTAPTSPTTSAASPTPATSTLPDPSTLSATTSTSTSTSLMAASLDPPISCDPSRCPSLAESDLGTLVAYDATAATLTWYEDDPRVVPVRADLDPSRSTLVFVGPGDVAYLSSPSSDDSSLDLVALDREGRQLARQDDAIDVTTSPLIVPASDGLVAVACCVSSTSDHADPVLAMAWVRASAQMTIPQYPYSRVAGNAWNISVGDGIAWNVAAAPAQLSSVPLVRVRGDGGAVAVLTDATGTMELVELLRDDSMSIHRYPVPAGATRPTPQSDGSLVTDIDDQYTRLTPPIDQLSPRPVNTDGH